MNGYGKRGGTSATAGRKAETIEMTAVGLTFRKRVFFGQRFLTVTQRDENGRSLVTASHTAEEAQRRVEEALDMGCDIAFCGRAEVRA